MIVDHWSIIFLDHSRNHLLNKNSTCSWNLSFIIVEMIMFCSIIRSIMIMFKESFRTSYRSRQRFIRFHNSIQSSNIQRLLENEIFVKFFIITKRYRKLDVAVIMNTWWRHHVTRCWTLLYVIIRTDRDRHVIQTWININLLKYLEVSRYRTSNRTSFLSLNVQFSGLKWNWTILTVCSRKSGRSLVNLS